MMPTYPHITVPLSGEDDNAFAIIGRVAKALRRAGENDAAGEFTRAATACESYDALLQLTMRTVDVT